MTAMQVPSLSRSEKDAIDLMAVIAAAALYLWF
jgi:hypothetical protein